MSNSKINLKAVGFRLGLVVAKYPDGKKGAMAIAKISSFTLDRYLTGKITNIPLVNIAEICHGQNISLNWLLYGDDYNQHLVKVNNHG